MKETERVTICIVVLYSIVNTSNNQALICIPTSSLKFSISSSKRQSYENQLVSKCTDHIS